jgi:hypothetical protein
MKIQVTVWMYASDECRNEDQSFGTRNIEWILSCAFAGESGQMHM